MPFHNTTEKEIIHLSSGGGGGSSRTRELAATFNYFPRQSLKSYPACLSTARVFWCCMGTDAGVDVRFIYSLELFFLYLFFFPQECTRRVKGSLFWYARQQRLLFFDGKAHVLSSLGATLRVRDEPGIEASRSDETF